MNLKSHLLRLLKLACLAAFICPQVRGEEEDIGKLLDQAIEREVAKLQPNSLKLPEPASELRPPPWIESAGKEFVSAWRTWAQIMARRPVAKSEENPPGQNDLINANENWEAFHELLKRSIEENPPPRISEYSRFTYQSLDWCADGAMHFSGILSKGVTLTMLRNGEYFVALQRLAANESAANQPILKAFGLDAEEVRIGSWLNQASLPEELCKTGGERSARMMMDWVELRWDVELARFKTSAATHRYENFPEPYAPRVEISQFLRPDNGVSEETKARIAKFIETRGLEMHPLRSWLYRYPAGSEKWLVPLAKVGINHELNVVRRMSSGILTRAGIAHAEPERLPDPRFNVLINALSWPGVFGRPGDRRPGLPVSLNTDECSKSVYLVPAEPGLFTIDSDSLLESGRIVNAEVRMQPIEFGDGHVNPSSLWLRAKLPLPIDFQHVNTVEIESYDFKIIPRFPERIGPPEEEVFEVEFSMVDNEKQSPPRYSSSRMLVKGRQSLVLPNVSPGDYWLKIYHPGAALTSTEKVTVSWWRRSVRPQLHKGSCLVVPVDWPEAKDPKKLPPELARSFVWFSPNAHESLRSVVKLKRSDGSVVDDFGRSPFIVKDRFPNSVIFPYLPTGEYEVESPDRTIEPEGTYPGCVIRKTSMKVEIREDSPVFVVTKPLKIDYTRKD